MEIGKALFVVEIHEKRNYVWQFFSSLILLILFLCEGDTCRGSYVALRRSGAVNFCNLFHIRYKRRKLD